MSVLTRIRFRFNQSFSSNLIVYFLCICALIHTKSSYAQDLIVGTYTNNNSSKGIYIYHFDIATGKATEVSTAAAGNPSYQAVAPNDNFVYSVNENDTGKISSFKYNSSNGELTFINQQSNNGSAPCYVSVDKTGKWLFAANYSSGNLTVHPILTDGSIGGLQQNIQHQGSGPNKERQEAPHTHCAYVSPDNRFVYAPDLGIDKVMIYPFDAKNGKLNTQNSSFIAIPAGGGPRHIVFTKNGKWGYIIEELSGAIMVIKRNGNKHTIVQSINNLPKEFNGASADIHLSPDERFVYSSHRGNSTIQIHQRDTKTGKLRFIGQQATNGNFPRNFTIHPSGKFLLAANQKSNDITIFKRDVLTGLLTDTHQRIEIPTPVCLQWIGGSAH